MQREGLDARASEASVYQTYRALIQHITKNAAVYVGGSNFIVADFLAKAE